MSFQCLPGTVPSVRTVHTDSTATNDNPHLLPHSDKSVMSQRLPTPCGSHHSSVGVPTPCGSHHSLQSVPDVEQAQGSVPALNPLFLSPTSGHIKHDAIQTGDIFDVEEVFARSSEELQALAIREEAGRVAEAFSCLTSSSSATSTAVSCISETRLCELEATIDAEIESSFGTVTTVHDTPQSTRCESPFKCISLTSLEGREALEESCMQM